MTATIEPNQSFHVQEFCVDGTYYVNDEDGLLFKLAQHPANTSGAVAVVLDVDDGAFHEVRVEPFRHSPFEALSKAAEEILRVRDHLLKLHGYASIEECRAAQGSAPDAEA